MKKDQMIKLFGRIYTISGENTPVGDGDLPAAGNPTSKPENAIDDAEEHIETEKDRQSGVIELDSGNNQEDDDVADEKTLKKPDKIIPCPRCNSMDTKFCYHNNYNVNQPRHFCKSCQRYWTSGGTMRNVPVGAGRRKNKNAATCRHITVSETISIQNGTVLSFGPESMKAPNEIPNGLFYRIPQIPISIPVNGEIGDDCSSRSSVTTSNSIEEGFAKNGMIPAPPTQEQFNGFHPHQIPYLSYPVPAFYQPMPPFWNCSYPNSWAAIPWLSPPDYPAASSILGKHSREGELIRPKSTNAGVKDLEGGAILIPKTLRIDDPDEAAKSSIWTTLGIKNDNISNRGSLFKGFESKDGENNNKKNNNNDANLMANPAAMSRSVRLQEGA